MTKPSSNHLPQNLKILREHFKVTQSFLNDYLEFKKGVYSTYENNTTPKLPALLKLIRMYREFLVDSKTQLSVELLFQTDLRDLPEFRDVKLPQKSDLEEVNVAGPANDISPIRTDNRISSTILADPGIRKDLIEGILQELMSDENWKKELSARILDAMR